MDFDNEKYARLLTDALPAVIETEADRERVAPIIDDLMRRGNLAPEEIETAGSSCSLRS